MKAQLNYSQINNINNNMLLRKRKNNTQAKLEEQNKAKQTHDRPAQAISFGGSAGLNKALNKTIEFVNDNEAAYNAIYSLIVAGILKPMAVLSMPGSEEKDKQIVATKNFLQAFLGSFLSLTIGGGFIKKSIDVVKRNLKLIEGVNKDNTLKVFKATDSKVLEMAEEILKKKNKGKKPSIDEIAEKARELVANFENNHKKAFEKNPSFIKKIKDKTKADTLFKNGKASSYEDAFEVLWKNSTGAITAICKAKISSLLLPGVMAFLFAKKNLEKAQAEKMAQEAKQNTLSNNASFKNEQAQFQRMLNKDNSNISFKGGLMDSAIDGFAGLVEKAGMSGVGEKLASTLARTKKPSARMADIESIAITTYWLQNTARSKKIEPSQKLGLNVHSALVTIVSSTAAFLIDWALDGVIDKSKTKYKQKLENIAKSQTLGKDVQTLDKILEGESELLKMEVKNQITSLLDKKITKEGVENITDDEIKAILQNLMSSKELEKELKNGIVNEGLIKNAFNALSASEPIRKEISRQCEDMVGAKDIAKNLSRAIGDEKTLAKAIEKLTDTYGKKLGKFKSLTIFTLVVRFLVPVLMVPVSGKLKKKIIEWTGGKADKK